jgi:hypothetical protein
MSQTSPAYSVITKIIAANSIVEFHGDWDYFSVVSATDPNGLEISIDNQGFQPYLYGATLTGLRAFGVKKITLRDTSGLANTVTVSEGGAGYVPQNGALLPAGAATAALQTSILAALAAPIVTQLWRGTPWAYAPAAAGIVNTNVAVTIRAAGAAGVRHYVTGLDLYHEALTTATLFSVRDGAAGTVLWRTFLPTGVAGRLAVTFPTPLRGSAATLLEMLTETASGAGAVWANVEGFSV